MKRIIFFCLFSCIFGMTLAQNRSLSGIWQGKIDFGTQSLKLVLVVENHGDTLTAVLDSPDQYATDIKVDAIELRADTLTFKVKALAVSYKGVWQGDSIKGKFTQNGRKRSLTLRPTTERKLFPRPQEPQPPYPYQEVQVNFTCPNNLPAISGTLTLPTDSKPRACVILITGSGWQDRDESIMGHKPFKLLADQLTRAGYAVFRYDDAPAMQFQKMTTFDFAAQACCILDTLSQRTDLQNVPLGLLGHSEGGLVAWISAANNPKVKFIVSMAGVGVDMKQILLYQLDLLAQKEQMAPQLIQNSLALSEHIYTIVEKAKTPEKARTSIQKYLTQYSKKCTDEERAALHLREVDIVSASLSLTSDWYFTLMHIKPAEYMSQVKCPVLALNGSKDTQVEAATNLEAMCKHITPNNLNQFITIPDVNHLFQKCETGFSDEYGEIEQTIFPVTIHRIIQWLGNCGF